jgi:hypothetical protein
VVVITNTIGRRAAASSSAVMESHHTAGASLVKVLNATSENGAAKTGDTEMNAAMAAEWAARIGAQDATEAA